jgi:hypothetical protein
VSGIPQISAALRLDMDWTSVVLWVEVLLAAFSSGLVFGLRSGVWSRRSSRATASRSGSAVRPAAVPEARAMESAPEPARAASGPVAPAPVLGPLIEFGVPGQTPMPVEADPRAPVGVPAMPNPERHGELYAAEYSRQIRRLKKLRRETSARLSIAAQAPPGREATSGRNDSPVEELDDGPSE